MVNKYKYEPIRIDDDGLAFAELQRVSDGLWLCFGLDEIADEKFADHDESPEWVRVNFIRLGAHFKGERVVSMDYEQRSVRTEGGRRYFFNEDGTEMPEHDALLELVKDTERRIRARMARMQEPKTWAKKSGGDE